MAAKPASLPGISDIRLMNLLLAVSLWFSCTAWLGLLYYLTPLAQKQLAAGIAVSPAQAFWVALTTHLSLYPLLAVAALGLLGWLLKVYLKKASLRLEWPLPLLQVALNLGALAGLLYVLTPVLLQ